MGCAELPELADLCLSQNLGNFSTSLLQIFCTVLIFLLFLWDFNDMNSRCFYSVPWVSKPLFVTLLPSCFSYWAISVDILIYLIHHSATSILLWKILLKRFQILCIPLGSFYRIYFSLRTPVLPPTPRASTCTSVVTAARTSSVIPASRSSQGWHASLFPEGLVRLLWFSVCSVILVSTLDILNLQLGDSSGECLCSWFCFSVQQPSWAQAVLGLLPWVVVLMSVPLIGALQCCFGSLPCTHFYILGPWAGSYLNEGSPFSAVFLPSSLTYKHPPSWCCGQKDRSFLGLGGQLSSPEALLGTHLRPTLQERRGNRTDENFTPRCVASLSFDSSL